MSHLRNGIRIVVASEPRAYREALAGVLSARHPGSHVVAADPAEIHRMPDAVAGALVLGNEITGRVSELAAGWIRITPEGAVHASSVADVQATGMPNGLDAVVRAVDSAYTALAQVR
jgi:hypothetical protein